MEFIEGIKISNTAALVAAGIDPNQVALIMMEAFCEQILVNGFFHADPHPGNLLVLPGPVVVFLDFGLAKELPEEFRVNYARLTAAILQGSDERMVEAFRALGFKTERDDPGSLTALGHSFFESAGPEQRPYVDRDVMADVNERMARSLQENPVTQIPPDILLVFRVLGLMSGLQKQLDSTVDMASTIEPYAHRESGADVAGGS
jgi:predicted unusual protein kinase regulating ubiquinone biosynthesis (AarF/ABC1/UbiB family)